METAPSLTTALESLLRQRIADANGWIGFDRFMDLALYAPGLGYYARGDAQFGVLPVAGGVLMFLLAFIIWVTGNRFQ